MEVELPLIEATDDLKLAAMLVSGEIRSFSPGEREGALNVKE